MENKTTLNQAKGQNMKVENSYLLIPVFNDLNPTTPCHERLELKHGEFGEARELIKYWGKLDSYSKASKIIRRALPRIAYEILQFWKFQKGEK